MLHSLTAHFVVFFVTLYRSMLSALLSRCIQLKHSLFSIIAFCTFIFHYHISLVSHLPLLVTPNSSEVPFLMQVTIFIHMLFTSPPSCQGSNLRTLFERFHCLSFKFPPLHLWHLNTRTSLKVNPKAKIHYHKLILRHDTLFRYHLTI
jgi:hypothetical protein